MLTRKFFLLSLSLSLSLSLTISRFIYIYIYIYVLLVNTAICEMYMGRSLHIYIT